MTDAHTDQPGAADADSGQTHPHVRQHTVVVPDDLEMVDPARSARRAAAHHGAPVPPGRASTCAATSSTSPGPSAEVALVERLIDELLDVIEGGQPLNRDAVERSIQMLRAQTVERPADVLTMNIVSNRGRTIRPKTLGQKRYVDAIDEQHHRLRHRPGRHRQDLPRDGQGRRGAAGQAGQPHHPDPPGGRGRRAARVPARHAQRQDRPLPAPALRRAARHGRPRVDPEAAWRPAPSRSRRWPTCAAAR